MLTQSVLAGMLYGDASDGMNHDDWLVIDTQRRRCQYFYGVGVE